MLTSGRCEACACPLPGGAWICDDCAARLPPHHVDAIARVDLLVRATRRAAGAYVRALPPLPCAEEGGCTAPRRAGGRYCLRHSGTGIGGAARFVGGTALPGEEGDADAA